MREYVAQVTNRGQLTLPAAVRRELGLKPGDQVAIVVTNDRAEVRRLDYTIESASQTNSTPADMVAGDFDAHFEEATATDADAVEQ